MKRLNEEGLAMLLRSLRLPAFVELFDDAAVQAEKQAWSFPQYLFHLASVEVQERKKRKIVRNLKRSRLPLEKTIDTLELNRLPVKIRRQVPTLCEGAFVEKAENVLAFGLPGRGKTHLTCAIGHALIERGYQVLFTPAYGLVQRLLIAKRDLRLEDEFKKLDRFDVVIIDDIGYVQQGRDEMEVLFTFLGERYERRSVMITSNLLFSQWDRIFKDPMTTACAIDRVIHHSTILELTGKSYRSETAKKRNKPGESSR